MLTNRINRIKRRRKRLTSSMWCLKAQQLRRIINQVLLTSRFSRRKLTKIFWNRAESLPVSASRTRKWGTKVRSRWMSMTISKSWSLAARNLIISMKCKNCRNWQRRTTNRSSKTWRVDTRDWRHTKRSSASSRSLRMRRILANLQREVVRGPNGHEQRARPKSLNLSAILPTKLIAGLLLTTISSSKCHRKKRMLRDLHGMILQSPKSMRLKMIGKIRVREKMMMEKTRSPVHGWQLRNRSSRVRSLGPHKKTVKRWTIPRLIGFPTRIRIKKETSLRFHGSHLLKARWV